QDTNARFIGVGVDSGSSLVIDGVVYGASSSNTVLGNGLVKVGGGSLELRGSSSATVSGYGSNPATPYTGTTAVNAGTLILNKPGQAIAGTLFIGDSRGGDNADVVQYGIMAGPDEIANGLTVTVLSSGKL